MTTQEFKIEGMSCGHCVMAVKKELSKLNLESAEVEIGSAKVNFDETKVDSSLIESAISEAGYKVVK
jgi:copper chaperone CopZ